MNTQTNARYLDVSTLCGKEGSFAFFKLPQFLLTNSRFRKLSSDAKLIYSAMLNRLSLSAQNGWEWNGLNFVYFSLHSVMELLGCSKPKAVKTLKELRDFRLIEGRRCADHKRVRYFFLDVSGHLEGCELPKEAGELPEQKPENVPDPSDSHLKAGQRPEPDKSTAFTGSACSGQQSEPDRSISVTCAGQKRNPEQVHVVDPNKTDQNKTDLYQDHPHPEAPAAQRRWRWSQKELIQEFTSVWREENEVMLTEQELTNLDSLIRTVSKTLSSREWFNINGQRVEAPDVHLRLMLLDSEELSYALEYLYHSAHSARCFSAYAISVLYNAPEEAEQYWSQRVQSDQKRGYAA